MAHLLYDYVDINGKNKFAEWTQTLQKKELAKLHQVLDKLEINGDDLLPQVLSGTDEPGVMKLRIHGQVQLRPLLCRGPLPGEESYTLLMGAFERGGKFNPKTALATAAIRKIEVVQDPTNRRKPHEHITNKAR